jgi:hypothetical protein
MKRGRRKFVKADIFITIFVGMLFLASCTVGDSSGVPEPPSVPGVLGPFGQAGAYGSDAYVEYVSLFAVPKDVFDVSMASVEVKVGEKKDVLLHVKNKGDDVFFVVYKYGYFLKDGKWERFEYAGEIASVEDSRGNFVDYWLESGAKTLSLGLDDYNTFSDGTFVLAYGCIGGITAQKCNGRQWMLHRVKITEAVPEKVVVTTKAAEIAPVQGIPTKIIVKKEEHQIDVKEVKDDSVTLVISSDPQTITLQVGQSKKLNVDANLETFDVRITLKAIVNGQPVLDIQEIDDLNLPDDPEAPGATPGKGIACTDSDGSDANKKGTVKSNAGTFTDGCVDKQVVEYTCKDNKEQKTLIACANGCKEGICVKEKPQQAQASCTDSDGGKNYDVKGYVSFPNDPSFGTNGKKYDFCLDDDKQVKEYVCTGGEYKGDHNYECPNGCKDGACVPEVPSFTLAMYSRVTQDDQLLGIYVINDLAPKYGQLDYNKVLKNFYTIDAQKALVIVGSSSPASHVLFAADIAQHLEKRNIKYKTVVSDEIPISNMLSLFVTPTYLDGTCTDTDFGKTYSTKGMVKTSIGTGIDSCNKNAKTGKIDVLYEFYCDARKQLAKEERICEDGCYEGACISEKTQTLEKEQAKPAVAKKKNDASCTKDDECASALCSTRTNKCISTLNLYDACGRDKECNATKSTTTNTTLICDKNNNVCIRPEGGTCTQNNQCSTAKGTPICLNTISANHKGCGYYTNAYKGQKCDYIQGSAFTTCASIYTCVNSVCVDK